MTWLDEFRQVRNAQTLAIDAKTRAKHALDRIPTISEARRLNSQIVELGILQAKLDSRRIALLRVRTPISPPTAEQTSRIKVLVAEVQRQSNAALTASMTLDLAGRILEAAGGVAA